MAIVRAVKSGNWSDVTVWNTGALPTSVDDVYANTFTVTIDISPTVLSISTAATTGVTSGGTFVPTNGITLTCTGAGLSATTSTCLVSSLVSGQSFTLNAALTSLPNNNNIYLLHNSSTGSCTVVGNVGGSTNVSGGLNQHSVVNSSSGIISITGNVTGNGGLPSYGVLNSSTGTINITGNVTGSSYQSSNNYGVVNSSGGTVSITGNVSGGGLAIAVLNSGLGTVSVTGTLTATNTVAALSNSSLGAANIIGSIVASASVGAISASASSFTILTGPFLTSANGINPLSGCTRWFWANSNVTPTYYQIRTANLATIRPLYTADSVGGNPAVTNVRSGTVYGPNSELTGTCAVPPAGSVALGVPVDSTTGTAVLTQANFQAALTAQGLTSARAANLDNLDTAVSTRLPTASYLAPLTAATTRSALGLASANLDTQLAPLPNLDTTVSSRLASASYQAPLDASGTRTAIGLATANLDTQFTNIPTNVRTNLATELGRIDATVSSRLAAASYQAPLDAAGTRTAIGLASANLDTQLDSLPTAVENAQAVRTELTTELGRIDIATSTRLASADYTTPPTSVQNAQAVRTELTTELGRIDTTVSSRLATTGYTTPPTVGDIATAVWNAATSALSNLGSIGKLLVDNINASISSRLASASYQVPLDAPGTRAAVGLATANLDTQLAPLPNLDTTVSSRLASASYQTPLDAAGTRTAIGLASANLDTQLAPLPNLDTTVSSRLASASYQAPLDASGTRAAVGLATANLDTQLAPLPNLDATVSSRLASASYQVPLDAPGTRAAVGLATANLDTQLAPLPNLDTTVSSRLASASYQTPLDAAGTRTAIGLASANLDTQFTNIPANVRTNLTTELGRIDTTVSSRSTFDPALDVVAHVTLVDTTTDLTNPPVVPTPEQIATAVRTELEPELDLIDVATSTRLASVDYTTPPTALENAQAVEVQLSLPLGNMDVAVSSRSTFDPALDTVAHVTLVDTTTDLTNPPVVPTPEQIAASVRTELSPELDLIDVATSTRLAAADYEQPPTPEQNAGAVRTELAPELDRLSNCATVDTTGQQIQNALSI